jgi:hypothetical protein
MVAGTELRRVRIAMSEAKQTKSYFTSSIAASANVGNGWMADIPLVG